MTKRSARTVVTITFGGIVAGALAASPAIAAPLPATLDCGEAGQVLVNIQGNAFRVIDSTRNFVLMSGSVLNADGTKTVISAPNGTQKTRDLVTCTYIGPESKRSFEVSGFFTPAT
jgi:hypothetical protein